MGKRSCERPRRRRLRLALSVPIWAIAGSVVIFTAVVLGRFLSQPSSASYMGKSEVFDKAVVTFSRIYADQAERDYAAFKDAIRKGRIEVQEAA